VVELAELRKRSTSADHLRIASVLISPVISSICFSIATLADFLLIAPMTSYLMIIRGLPHRPPIASDVVESAILLIIASLHLSAICCLIGLGLDHDGAPMVRGLLTI
jgi:hypothetical protein